MKETLQSDRDVFNRRILSSQHRIGRRILINKIAFEFALEGKDADPDQPLVFVTIPKLCEAHPGLTQPAVRALLWKAERAAEAASSTR